MYISPLCYPSRRRHLISASLPCSLRNEENAPGPRPPTHVASEPSTRSSPSRFLTCRTRLTHINATVAIPFVKTESPLGHLGVQYKAASRTHPLKPTETHCRTPLVMMFFKAALALYLAAIALATPTPKTSPNFDDRSTSSAWIHVHRVKAY